MGIKRIYGRQSVLEAARTRIKNVFENGLPVYLSFSCGKDSLCMAHITYEMIRRGEIDGKQLTVIFIDEEGLYQSMLEAAYRWRRKFMSIGVNFDWYCLPVKQTSTIDHLSATESWITWDPAAKKNWMRKPPKFAITKSPLVPYPGECNYQTFCGRLCKNGVSMIGLRAAESIQRLKAISAITTEINRVYPIYDWKDNDIWLYIKEQNLEFPEIYIRLYEAGVTKPKLRLCSFFGDSTVTGLRYIAETEPELWEKIERRYPNAYLVLLYWDSEMFKRSTRKRKELEAEEDTQDYKELVFDLLFRHPERFTIPKDTKKYIKRWKEMVKRFDFFLNNRDYREIYEKIIAGDPKGRSHRALYTNFYEKQANISKREQRERYGK